MIVNDHFPKRSSVCVHDVGWLLLMLSLCKIGLFKETFWPRVCVFFIVVNVCLYTYCLLFYIFTFTLFFCCWLILLLLSMLICCRFVVSLVSFLAAVIIHCICLLFVGNFTDRTNSFSSRFYGFDQFYFTPQNQSIKLIKMIALSQWIYGARVCVFYRAYCAYGQN